MTDDWTDRIVGARMTVDQKFADRVSGSQFSRQQWGLIMTAVEFDIESPDDPDTARLVADTSALPNIMPELDNIQEGPPGMDGPDDSGSDGIVGVLRDALGFSGGGGDDGLDRDRLETAETLVDEYARQLQSHLEQEGRWADVRAAAAGQ